MIENIHNSNPKIGIIIEGRHAIEKWNMYEAWKAGISPLEYRQCRSKDIKDIMDIDSAVSEKVKTEQEMRNIIAGARRR